MVTTALILVIITCLFILSPIIALIAIVIFEGFKKLGFIFIPFQWFVGLFLELFDLSKIVIGNILHLLSIPFIKIAKKLNKYEHIEKIYIGIFGLLIYISMCYTAYLWALHYK